MKCAAVSLVFVVGCRFDLPGVTIDAPVDAPVDTPADANVTDAPMIDAPASACPADYAPLTGGNANHVYRRALPNGGWIQQDDYCRTTSALAYLAVPDDAAELASLYQLAADPLWIGINDRATEGTYVKSNGGAATFLPWEASEPNNGPGDGDCVTSRTGTTIEDHACGVGRAAVCECHP